MTATYDTLANPAIGASDTFATVHSKAINGFSTALSDFAGSSDPSTGAGWGASQVGYKWLDTTSAQNPVLKRWQQLTTAPTYGWRTLRLFKWHLLSAPVAVTLATASPAAADVTWTDEDFTTDLDTVTDNDDMAVAAVMLRCMVRETGTIRTTASGTTSSYGGIEWRKKGDTVAQHVYAQVASVPNEATLIVGLDSSEIAQYQLTVGSASPNLEFTVEIVAYLEAI